MVGNWLVDLMLLAMCSFPLLFLRLGDLPIVLWDESRLANNALEMYRSGFSLVTTYVGHPDMWNTKPPLLIWLMTASLHIFGPSEWALRLPSALAAMATSGIVYWYCRSVSGSRTAGIAGALALLTTYGFVAPHVARTGDYDALLVFFTTAILACCYRILEIMRLGARPSNGLFALTSLALLGAIMTKGVAGVMILPGIALASLANGTIFRAFRDWRAGSALCAAFVATSAFYIVREAAGAGYLEAVWLNELGGRFMSPLEGHRAPAAFYLLHLICPWNGRTDTMYLASAAPWSWLVPILVPLGMREKQLRPVLAYLAIALAMFLVILSAAQTKISWYVAPAYPMIACLVALSAFAVLRSVQAENSFLNQHHSNLLLLGIFAFFAAIIGPRIIERNRQEAIHALANPELQSAVFLRDVMHMLRPGEVLRIVRRKATPSLKSPVGTQYSPQQQFYASLMQERGIDAQVVTPDYRPRHGEKLAWCGSIHPDASGAENDGSISEGPCHLVSVVGARLKVR